MALVRFLAARRRPVRPVRPVAWAVATLVLGASLAGCTETDGAAPAPLPAGSSSPNPSVSGPLEVAVYGNGTRLRAYREIVRAFDAAHPDRQVRLTAYHSQAEALDPTLDALQHGTGPDVFLADESVLPQLVATRGLQPVDTMLEDRDVEFGDGYQRVGLTSFSANARLQCMPAEVSPLVVYYNKRLFRRSQPGEPIELPNAEDPSWDWAEFDAVARATAGLDRLGPIKGVWLPPDVETLTAFLRSNGTDIVDDVLQPTSLNLTSDDALEVLDAVAGLARDPAVSLTPRDLRQGDPVQWFTRGRLGMLVGTRNDLPRLRAAAGLRFDVLPLPSFSRSRTVATMNGWCVNAGTGRAAEAADFVAFAVGPEASAIASRSGAIVPSGLDAIHDRSFIQPRQQPASAEVYAATLRRAEPMPFSAAWPTVAAEVGSVLTRIYAVPGTEVIGSLESRMTRLDERSVGLFAAAGASASPGESATVPTPSATDGTPPS